MINITVLTATRAEYGLLAPIIKKMNSSEDFDVKVVVTGAHLSADFGYTYKEIENDGVKIDKKIDILGEMGTDLDVSVAMSKALSGFGSYFAEERPDALLVLGDRYETLAVCIAAMNERIPIIHLHGGETTEGAIDEAIRHAITKLSFLHFTSTEEYRNRVIQLGESPDRVFNVGAMGVENALNLPLLSREELYKDLKLDMDKSYAVLTFHPVTLEGGAVEAQLNELFAAIDKIPDLEFIVTKANADAMGNIINNLFEEYAKKNNRVHIFASLGVKRYLSAVKYSKFVMGNSSSGLIEVPSFGVPTINIGDRQRGRLKAESVIDCDTFADDILKAVAKAMDVDFGRKLEDVSNPYEGVGTSDEIVAITRQFFKDGAVDLKKKFYDIRF